MDPANENISWETYLTAGIKAFDLSRLDDAEKLFQKALIESRKELAFSRVFLFKQSHLQLNHPGIAQ